MFEPTILYKKGGQLRGPYRTTYSEKSVKTQEEFDLGIKDGWYDNLDDAVNPIKEINRKPHDEGKTPYIIGNAPVKRKEDYKKKPKIKKAKQEKSMKEKTKDAIRENEKE